MQCYVCSWRPKNSDEHVCAKLHRCEAPHFMVRHVTPSMPVCQPIYRQNSGQIRFEVVTEVTMKMAVLRLVAPCSLVWVYRRFRQSVLPPSSGRPDDGGSTDLWNLAKLIHGATSRKTAIFRTDTVYEFETTKSKLQLMKWLSRDIFFISFHCCAILTHISCGGWTKGPLNVQFHRDVAHHSRIIIAPSLYIYSIYS
jgi:hypothetical protein